MLQRLADVPEQWRERLRNNGGGFVNHVFYWETMCPSSQRQERERPSGQLAQDIARTFGSLESFQSEFSAAAASLFGSGYVWLCEDKAGQLSILSTHNQVPRILNSFLSPLTSGLLVCLLFRIHL